ncbi:hypothetical protein BDW22DRAFT_988594 [Trametopsis cervina]|nr:hypothetical protein BDW22DRAFT_988594 [Trametopsis cervina]
MTSVYAYPTTTNHHYGYMESAFSRHANSAGMALPHIPRRTSSSGSRAAAPAVQQPVMARSPPATVTAKVVIQPPTPPDVKRRNSPPIASTSKGNLEETSSGSGSETLEVLLPKARRARVHQRGPLPSSMRPPEQSTPTPATLRAKFDQAIRVPFPSTSDETPRPAMSILAPKPRPGVSPLVTTTNTDGIPPRSVSVASGATGRKKSGEPLKSSLKSRRPVVRGDLSVVTGPMSSKSEPSTPTCIKSVHFDSQLEHVKLFLAEQKPLAVSRDGSPTDDTSGTESDFPAFIYGKDEEKGPLEVVTQGLRVETAEERAKVDVKLESVKLGEDGSSIVGHVRVRNLAFEKWVAVRFTCDWWQTTSEVTARYLETLPDTDGLHDRFQFSIRLNDMMSRIEDKTMFLAVRYTSAGREMWDNNDAQNYKVTFVRQKVSPVPAEKKAAMDESGRGVTGIAVLKSKLEMVVKANDNRPTVGGFLSSRINRSQSLSPSASATFAVPASPAADEERGFTLKSNIPLSARYDFGASLKSNWRRTSSLDSPSISPSPSSVDHSRGKTHPNAIPQFPRRTPADKRAIVELTRGSPRIFDTEDVGTPALSKTYYASASSVSADLEDTPVPVRKTARNHTRGYFDLGVVPSALAMGGVRRTPPGSPGVVGSPAGSGRNSPIGFEGAVGGPVGGGAVVGGVMGTGAEKGMWRVPSGGSEESTPSSGSNSNEGSSRESSPNTSPYEGPVSLGPEAEDAFPRSPSPGDGSSYSAFLNSFCFYTGSEQPDFSEMHRSHSASSVEEFLSTSPYLGADYLLSPGHTPTRSSSFDDVATISGHSTPTANLTPKVWTAVSPPMGTAH